MADRPSNSYRDLAAWQKALELAEAVYSVSRGWPREEIYGMTAQLRRAALSVPSNIADGQGKESIKEFVDNLSAAKGSLLEMETQLMLAQRLGYLDEAATGELLEQSSEVGSLIEELTRTLLDKLRSNN